MLSFFWKRFFRGAAIAAALLFVLSMVGVAWLLRDPEPYFVERRSTDFRVELSDWIHDESGSEQDVTLYGENGLTVRLSVRRPLEYPSGNSANPGPGPLEDSTLNSSNPAPLPLYVILGGQRRGRAAGALLGDPRGNILASLDYPFEGDDRAKGFELVRQVPLIRRALFDTPPAVMLALDYLLTRSDIDTTRVELVGASFGAPFAAIAAAIDERVDRLWIAHGGGKPYRLIETGLRPEISFGPARSAVAGLANILASAPRLKPERWIGRVAPRPTIMINAEDDERIPRESVEALWNATLEPRELIWLPGGHMQGSRPEVLQRLVDTMLERGARP